MPTNDTVIPAMITSGKDNLILSDADRPPPSCRQPQQRPGEPSLGSAWRTLHGSGACVNHEGVPCTKKGDCWHQEKLLEGCFQSLLSESLVKSRSVGELFINYSPKKNENDNS